MPFRATSQKWGGEAADKAAAAKTSMSTAMNSASQSMMSVLKRRPRKPTSDESQSTYSTGSSFLWKKLPAASWKCNILGPAKPTRLDAGVVCDNHNSLDSACDQFSIPSEISTTGSLLSSDLDSEPLEIASEDEHWEALQENSLKDFSPEEMRCFAQNGMPSEYRHQFWQQLFSVAEVGDVDELQRSVPSEIARQIDLDVVRTRPRLLNDADRSMLRRVLCAYASYDPAVGYCQGMSDIAAVFVLLGFNEVAALRGLCSMSRSCCPDYFCPSLKGYVHDMVVLEVLVRETLPLETTEILDSLEVPLETLAADHFLALASHTSPLKAVVRLWDLFLLEGSSAVFASFIALLQLYLPKNDGEPDHRCVDGPDKVAAFMRAASTGIADDLDAVLEKTLELIPLIPRSRIESLRRGDSKVNV